MLCQRRRHSRWRMLLVLFILLGLVRHGESKPVGASSESSSSTPAARRKSSSSSSQNIGSLSDFTWQAWLLVDTQTGSQPGMDSSNLLRRITPKSVFIAPALPACADGYRADNMNRCVKSVNIDESAHFSFLLQRLNALYANQDSNPQAAASKNEQKQSTGPLQLNIPLIPKTKPQSTRTELPETLPIGDLLATTPDESHANGKRTSPHETTVVTAYEVKNDTALDDEDDPMFFLRNSSADGADRIDQKPNAVVPVAEFVEETSNTNFSGVVDYKIPIDLKTLLNASSVKRLNVSDDITTGGDGVSTLADKRENPTEMSPTLVLLLSPTKLPSVDVAADHEVDDSPPLAHDVRTVAQTSDLTVVNASTSKEIVGVGVASSYELPSTWKLSEAPSIAADKPVRSNETRAMEEDRVSGPPDTLKLNESHDTDFVYDDDDDDDEGEDEEYSYGTDVPDEESTEAEGEEILKHGEAGMTIPVQNIERLHRDQQRLQQQQQQQQQQRNQTTDQKGTSGVRDQMMIRFNESRPVDKDEAGSNVSSEVSIDGDLILETTLLDVNTERLQITTKLPDAAAPLEIANGSDSESKESFDDGRRSTAPEVVFSSQDAHGTTSASLQGRKQNAENSAKVETRAEDGERNEELEAAPSSSSESLLPYGPPEEDSITGIRAIDEKSGRDAEEGSVKESASEEGSSPAIVRTFEPDVPAASAFEQISMNLSPAEDYVRFPDYARRPQSYVRFPASEANSIHSRNYKQHSNYPADDGTYDSTSTKSSVPVRQKSVYLMAPSTRKSDRQQSIPAAITPRQKQRPVLFRFWSKMPLVRDPAIYPAVDQFATSRSDDATSDVQQQPPRNRSLRRSSSRRTSLIADDDASPRDVNKVLARKRRRAPIYG